MQTKEILLSNLYHSYVTGGLTVEDLASELNLTVSQVKPVLDRISRDFLELSRLKNLDYVQERGSLLKDFLLSTRDWEVLTLEYNFDVNLFIVKFKHSNNQTYTRSFAVLTQEEAIEIQIEHEKNAAFENTKWYSKEFLADILDVPVEKIEKQFPKVLTENEVLGDELEPIAEWVLGKLTFIKRVATKIAKEDTELCGGALGSIGSYNGYTIYQDNA